MRTGRTRASRYYGPTHERLRRGRQNGRTQELRSELVALFESQNLCQYLGTTLIPATFLRVTVEVG